MTCLFCQIAEKKIPSSLVYEDESVVCFHDIAPQAPVHILVVPKVHSPTVLALTDRGAESILKVFHAIQVVAKQFVLVESGFRVVTNTGKSAGQSVDHVHFHILGGRSFDWPPG